MIDFNTAPLQGELPPEFVAAAAREEADDAHHGYDPDPQDNEPASDITTRKLAVTIITDRTGIAMRPVDMTLPQLAGHIGFTTAANKMALPWLKLALFGDKRSDKNSLRNNDNVLQVSGIEGDHDSGNLSFDEAVARIREANIRALLYTSASHEPGVKERWRILAPLSRNREPEMRGELVARVNGLLNGHLAGESFTLSQAYLYGHLPDAACRIEVIDGDFLDLRDDLDAGRIFKDGSTNGDHGANSGNSGGHDYNGAGPQHQSRADDDPEPVDVGKIEAALDVISPDCSYEVWLKIAAGLHHELGEHGFALFDRWSSKATGTVMDDGKSEPRYTQAKSRERWRGARTMHSIRIASVFYCADEEDPAWRQRYEQEPQSPSPAAGPTGQAPGPITIEETLKVFDHWLALPDQTPILAALGTVAANLLPGDPVWLGLIGPPSSAKTEILNSTSTLPHVVQAATMTVAGLLSGSPKKSQAKGAQGGLLRQINDFGIIVLKDFGSVLSMHPETKAEVLAALREIYDGAWTRHLGSDGGRTLSWQGKVGLLFAATGVIDAHYSVIGAMGDRFLLSRLAPVGRGQFSRALKHVGAGTKQMRQELAVVVTQLFAGRRVEPRAISKEEIERIDDAIMLVVRLRGAVARDRQSKEIEAVYGAEGTARIGLTLERLLAGLDTLGVDRETALRVVETVALDSVPPARRRAYDYLHAVYASSGAAETTAIAKMMELPTVTVRRVLEELVAYGLASRQSQGQGKPDLWKWVDWR